MTVRDPSGLTRREFLVTGAAVAGYTLAAGPLRADVISTPATGLVAGAISIPVAGREIPGYRAKPASAAKPPVVLVVQEVFGVHEYIRDVCRRLAQAGYLAVAPDLYVRQGDVSRMTSFEEIRPIVASVPDAQVMSDLDATAGWAATDGGDGDRLAITGFCWGGRIVWLYAAHRPKLRAGVAWYGRLAGDKSELQPKFPLDVVDLLRAPVLGLYGAEDAGIPLDTVERMRAAIAATNNKSRIDVFDAAPHGFHADYRPSYREAAAREGWTRMLAWFKANGV
ncbi:MAG: dienelactone hydrolase family protein [Myxococcota bacterium]